ncbi:MAG: hypothetical protein L6R39_002784 [Caloplaca ligustica]|nr:MAG: hypothetical protein L6R39_002784 [Caloplaca ligustica]
MGYQPVIDSYETCTGTDWTSRREVVAWGAGAELVVRVRWMGQSIEEQWQSARRNKASITEFDQHHHRSRWWRIVETTHREGQDDITAVKVLRNSQRPSQSREYIISGRASGGLDMVSIDHAVLNVWKKEACFITEGHHVRSASVNSAEQPLLAACIDDHTVAIYSVAERQDPIPPLEKIKLIHLNASKESSRALSTVFLRQDRLAISYGPSIEPIRVFEINPAAVSSRLVRTFSLLEGGKTDGNEKYREMVYPLVPLPQSAFANAAEGDLFLSGCYDGTIR